MLLAGDLGTCEHPEFTLYPLHPLQAGHPHSLEASGMGARLPYARAENVYAQVAQALCSLHDLLLGLGAARSGDYHGFREREEPPFIHRCKFKFVFHLI